MPSGSTTPGTSTTSTGSPEPAAPRPILWRSAAAALLVILVLAPWARAQIDARGILNQVILQLQTGTPNPQWYGVELWQTMAIQTQNTGVYLPLRQLGQPTNIVITEQLPLPTGMLYAMTVQHVNGMSTWVVGISTLTKRIEYMNFNVGGTPQLLPYPNEPSAAPSPAPAPNNPQPAPPSNPPPQGTDSDACKKFPNLC